MMSEDNDMPCPWCGGELPGKPGQYVKCRHCGSDIHWGDGKPYKTKFQAAQPNPVVRDVPVRMRPAPTTPIQQTVEPEEQSFVVENASEILDDLFKQEEEKKVSKKIPAKYRQQKRMETQTPNQYDKRIWLVSNFLLLIVLFPAMFANFIFPFGFPQLFLVVIVTGIIFCIWKL